MNEQTGNDLSLIVAQSIEEIKDEQGERFSLERINFAEFGRRTGLSRAQLGRLKKRVYGQTSRTDREMQPSDRSIRIRCRPKSGPWNLRATAAEDTLLNLGDPAR